MQTGKRRTIDDRDDSGDIAAACGGQDRRGRSGGFLDHEQPMGVCCIERVIEDRRCMNKESCSLASSF